LAIPQRVSYNTPMKFFNTAGPVDREIHYKIDPLTRWNMDEILTLIEQQKYFILHAPRQTGKTSCMLALRDYLNAEGRYLCVYANFEAAQTARNNVQTGMRSVLAELHSRTETALGGVCPVALKDYTSKVEENALNLYLADICESLDKSLILLIDEIDALVGDTLVSVLRQLRSGYDKRPAQFPQSVILCGVRDIKTTASTAATARSSPAAVASTSSRSRSRSAISLKTRCGGSTANTPARPGSSSRRSASRW
jgi:hypothetical protein